MWTQPDNEAIDWFTELLTFKTISNSAANDNSYNLCAQFLCNVANTIGLSVEVLPESIENKPIVVVKWTGEKPDLPVVILNSHYDVVPGGFNFKPL